MNTCSQCQEEKERNHFYLTKGRMKQPCKQCSREKRRTKDGVLKQRWLAICARIKGTSGHPTTANGKEKCEKEEFFRWARSHPEFHRLYDAWKNGGYILNDSPSVDRIDIKIGYTLENIQWLPMIENNQKGHLEYDRNYGRKHVKLTKNGEIMRFKSGKKASEYFGVNRFAVTNNIKMGHKLKGWTCQWEED